MSEGVPRHPEAQTMAAFVDGTLPPGEVAAVAEHLRGCGECRVVVGETARFTDEEEPQSRRSWWMYAAAILAVAIVATLVVLQVAHSRSPIDRLIAFAPHEHRTVEARLSGFSWARLQAPTRGEPKPDPADLKFTGAAGDVLDATANRRDAASGHAKGVAYLVIGRRNDGIVALERAATDSKDPKAWNDLAAARYTSAVVDEHPSQLPEALADADHALRLDPHFAEALFNRALILEHLGILAQARKAWTTYLEIDPHSDWSAEARAHLHKLSGISRRFDKKMIDTMPADQLVREFPEEARRYGEAVLLPDQVDRARAIGDALAAYNGEQLLRDAVGALERSQGSTRDALIEAYRTYESGRHAYKDRNAGVAEEQLRRASALFRQVDSPMSEVAAYYAASAAFDQHKPDARAELQRLLDSIDANRYRALAAQIDWELAVTANADGDWGAAAREADRAVSTFRALGERNAAAIVEGIGAIAYEMMGERDLAWSRRVRAYADLSAAGVPSPMTARLNDASITLGSQDHDAAASSLVDLIIDDVRGDPFVLAEVLTSRARLAVRANEDAAARTSINAVVRTLPGIADPALRESAQADVDLVDAELEARSAPRSAIAKVDRSIPLLTSGRLGHLLPEAYLQRGRAHRTLGEDKAAIDDLGSAMHEIKKQELMVSSDDESRSASLDTAARVVEEAIDFQLARGTVLGAFSAADQSHAAVDSDGFANYALPSFPSDLAVVEYAVRPHAVTLFCVSRSGVSAATVPFERNELANDVDAFAENIRRRAPLDEIRRDGSALYHLLIEPVKPQFASANEIVFVPDRQLYGVPFGALWDESQHRYLVEQYLIRFAPSARNAIVSDSRSLSPALVISDPPTVEGPPLPASREEASQIAHLQGAVLLAGAAATRSRFLRMAPASALIHFAGHANSSPTQSYGALVFAPERGDSGVMSSSDIARLALPRHPLVVLAACGTFRGNAAHVAGMSSLARSFLLAGARAVVGTLWEIDDDISAALFTRFHEQLRAGASPAQSLRDAQVEALRSNDARTAHPATWAPVEILGTV